MHFKYIFSSGTSVKCMKCEVQPFLAPESHISPTPQAQQAGRQTGKHIGRGASARNAASCWWRSVSSSSCGGSVPCVLARRNPSHPSAPCPHTRHCPSPPPRLRRRPGWGRPLSGWRRRRPRGCVQPGPSLSQAEGEERRALIPTSSQHLIFTSPHLIQSSPPVTMELGVIYFSPQSAIL